MVREASEVRIHSVLGEEAVRRTALLEITSALLAVIVADSLENIAVYGPYYVLGLFSVIVIGDQSLTHGESH